MKKPEPGFFLPSIVAPYIIVGGGTQAVLETQINTWVLGVPKARTATFASWFKEKDLSNYRIFIHRTPLRVGDRRIIPLWPRVYRSTPRVVSLREQLSADQQSEGVAFLESLLAAYAFVPSGAGDFVQSSGHFYWFSTGSPTKP